MADKIDHKGNVVIENGPQVSAVIDRVNGCKKVLSQYSDIKLLSSDQDGKGSRDGGLNVMQGFLTRFPSIQGVFTINDPQAVGSDLAAKQLNRTGIVITSVDGAPDIVSALKGQTQVQGSASQDPFAMGKLAIQTGYDIMNGKKPASPMILMESKLITRDNVGSYQGWTR
jgi:ribose transport system substrate-binding protein